MAEQDEIARILEENNIPSGNQLRQRITNTTDPLLEIKTFQEQNGIKMPSLEPVYKILEIHQVRRAEYYETAVQELTDRTCAKLRVLGELKTIEATRKLEAQLVKCFQMYKLARIRPIVLETLKQMNVVPEDYLEKIVADEQLYTECAINVRQQIWLKHEDLFITAVAPVVEAYLATKGKIINAIDMTPTNFFTCDTVKSRRQYPQIAELLNITGHRPELFVMLNTYLKRKFTETENNHYCSLRLEYSMAARDQNIEPIVKADLAQDFACCLDACLRDKHMDAQQNNRLKSIIEGKKKSPANVIAELAMVAADSHIIHFIGTIVAKVLRDMASHLAHLPRDHSTLQYLVKILQLGLNAREIIANELTMPAIDIELTTKFLPHFVSLMAEDVVRAELTKASAEMREAHLAEVNSSVSDSVKEYIANDKIAAFLWLHYCWNLFPIKNRIQLDMVPLLRYVDLLPNLCDKVTYRDPWIHLVAHRLLVSSNLGDILGDDTFIKHFFESYLLQEVEGEPCVKYQVLRLCHLLHQHMGDVLTKAIMEQISPERLVAHIASSTDYGLYEHDFRKVNAKLFPVEDPNPADFAPVQPQMVFALAQATFSAPDS